MVIRYATRYGATLIETVVVIGIIGLLVALLVPAVQQIRAASACKECLNNLRQIGIALHQYHDTHGALPPGISVQGGSGPCPFMSWNTRVLPFLEQPGLWFEAEGAYRQTADFLKGPPHPISTVVPVFCCPSDGRVWSSHQFSKKLTVAFTSYLGVEGTDEFREDGVLYLDSHVRYLEIKDGLSNTLLVGERPPSSDLRLGWWYAGWGQNKNGSAEMVLGLREVNYGTWTNPCPRGPYEYGPGDFRNKCDAYHFWSPHSAGANFVLADGSGRFIVYSANPVMPALATRSGGEVAELPD